MTNKSWLLTLTIFYILFSGGQQVLAQNADISKVKAALTSVNTNYGQAFAKGDSSLFLNSYTADACLLPANSPAICGRQVNWLFLNSPTVPACATSYLIPSTCTALPMNMSPNRETMRCLGRIIIPWVKENTLFFGKRQPRAGKCSATCSTATLLRCGNVSCVHSGPDLPTASEPLPGDPEGRHGLHNSWLTLL